MSARPSDSIALALRTGTRIVCAEEVLDEAGLAVPRAGGRGRAVPRVPRPGHSRGLRVATSRRTRPHPQPEVEGWRHAAACVDHPAGRAYLELSLVVTPPLWLPVPAAATGHFPQGVTLQRRRRRRVRSGTRTRTAPSSDAEARRPRPPSTRPRSRVSSSTDDVSPLPSDPGYRGPTACNAAGITYRQLDYWARTGLVEPTVRGATGSGLAAALLLPRHPDPQGRSSGCSTPASRCSRSAPPSQHLRERGTDDLTRVTLMSDGASVYECTSNDEVIDLLQGGQGVFGIAIGGVWREIEGTLAELPSERTRRGPPTPSPATSSPRAARPGRPADRHRTHDSRGRPATGRLASSAATVGWRRRHPARESRRRGPRQPERRRGNSSPEPLRHQDRAGQALWSGQPRPTEGEATRPSTVEEPPCPMSDLAQPRPSSTLRCRSSTGTSAPTTPTSPRCSRRLGLRLARRADGRRRARRHPRRSRLDLPAAARPRTRPPRAARRSPRHNRRPRPMIGLGYHGTITPPVIRRNVLEDPSWYTAYTPYQPEISQGRLEALLNFQTMVGDLTGLPTANASLLDEGTAAAEAMTLVRRANRKAAGPFVVDADALPQTIEVVRTRAEAMGIEVVVADLADGLPDGELSRRAGAVPRRLGPGPRPARRDRGRRTSADALAVVAADLLALTLLESPGALGADVVVGLLPALRRAAVLRRPARRLHVGRAPASSATCPAGWSGSRSTRRAARRTASPCRPASSTSAATRRPPTSAPPRCCSPWSRRCTPSTTAPRGCARIAQRTHDHAAALGRRAARRGRRGRPRRSSSTRSPCRVPGRAAEVVAAARDRRPAPAPRRRRPRRAVDLRGHHPADRSTRVLARLRRGTDVGVDERRPAERCPPRCAARRTYLTHEVFNAHHSETQMLRYLRRLSARDYALDRGMIPLGSCTMKLNATTEMEPVSLPGFADLHPFAPAEDATGYRRAGRRPGGLAGRGHRLRPGLDPAERRLAGRARRAARHPRLPPAPTADGAARDVCLIPSSAHGTNAASAVMAGHEGRRGQGHRRRLGRPRRPARQVRGARRRPRRDHGHLPLDPRRLRGHDHRAVPDRARATAARSTSTARTSTRCSATPSPASSAATCPTSTCTRPSASRTAAAAPASARSACATHLAPYLPSHAMHPEPEKRDGHRPDQRGAVRLGRASCRSPGPTCG